MEQDLYERSFSPQRPRSRISSEYSGASTTHPVEWQDDWIHREEQFKDTINALHTEQERIQKKTFTNWINSHVEHHRDQWRVNDLFADLKDGRILLALLEVITGDYLPCETFRHYTRAHYLSNVERALDYLRHRNIKLVNINSSDVVDGNETVILGLIWTIILNFQIDQDLAHLRENFLISPVPSGVQSGSYEARSRSVSPSPTKKPRLAARGRFQAGASKAMLKWCQKEITDCYGIPITNLSSSWKDGMAFLGLVKVLDPKLINLNDYRRATPSERMNVAFTLAHEQLGIPKFLEVSDIDVDRPDERSIMTYIAQFIKRFPEAKRNRQKLIMDNFPDVEALEANEKADYERIRDWCNDVLLMLKCLELSEERPYEAYDEYKKFSENFRTNISSYTRLKERYEEGRTLHMTEQNILELDSLWARLISEKQIWHNHLFRVLLGQEQLLCSRFEKYESELDQRVLLPPQRVTHYSKVNLEFRVQKHEDILLRLTHLRDELNSFLVKEYPTEVFALHDLQSELNAMITDLEQRLLEERCKLLLKRQLIIVDEWERRIARWEEFLASPGLNGERLAYEFELHVVQERIFDKFLELSKQLQRCLEILQNTPESDKHQRAEFLSSAVNANRRWKRIGEQLYEIREKLREYQMLLKKKGQKVDLDYNGKDVPDISLSSTSPVSPPAYIKSDRWLLHIQKVAAFTRWIDRMERDFESIDRENVSRVEYQRGLQRFRALCNEVVEHKTDGQDIIDTFYNCSAELPHNVASEEQRKINRLIRRYDSLIPSLEIVRSEVERNVHAHQVTSTHTETVQLVPDRPESVREHAVRIHTPAARGLSPTVSGGTSGYATPEFENALLRRSEPTTPSSFNRSPPLAYGISSQSSVNEGSPIEPSLIRDIDIDDETQRSASAASPRGTPAHTPGADERTFVRDVPIMDSASGSATHLRPTVKITSTHRTVGALSDDEDLETKRIKVDQSRKGLFPKGTVEKFEQTVTETTTERSLRNVAPEESSKISTLRAAFEKPTESQQKFTTKPKPGSVYDALRRKSKDSDSDNEDVSPKKRPPATSSRPSSTFLRSADDELTRLRQRPAGIVFESDVSNADVERAMSETPVSPSSVSEKPKYLRNVKTTTLVTSTETKTVRTVRAKSPPASEDVPYLGSGRLVGKIKHPVAFTTETQVRDEPVATESKSIGKVRPAAVFTTPTDTFVRRSSQEDIPQSKVRSHIEEIHRRASQEDITSPGTSEPESTGKAKTPFGFLKKHTKTEFEETTKTVKRVTVSPLSSAKRGNRVEPATVVRDADEQGVASPVREEILASFVRDPERPPPPVVRESTVADPTQTFVRTTERVVLRPHRVVDTESQSESVVRVVPYGATATLEADTPKQVNRLTNLFERATTDPALMTTVVEQEKVERVRVASPEREERVVSHHVTRSPGDISVSERVRRYELPEEPREQTVSERTKKYDDIFAPLDSSPGHFSVMETSLSSPTSTVVRDAVVTEYPPEEEREELTTTIVTEETKKPKKGLFGLFRSKKVAPEESITVAKVKKEPVTYSEVNTETRTMVREDRQWDTADREVEYGIPRIRTGSVPHHAGVSDAEMDDTLIKNGLVEQAANWRDQYPTDVEEFLGTNRKPVELLEEHVVTRTVGTTQSTEVSSITRPQTFVRDAVPVLIETPSVYHEKRTEVHTMHPTEIPERERLVTANEFIEETADREVPKRTSVRDLVTSYETVSHTRQPTEPHPSTPMEVEEVISSRKRPSPVEHTVGAPDYDMKVHAAKRPVLPFATAEHMEESISKRKSEKPAPSDTVVRRSVSPPPILGELEHVEETIVRRTERKPRKPEQDTTFEETLTHPVGEAEPLVRPLDRPGFDIRHSSGPRDIDIGLVDERESAMIKSVTVRPEHLHAQSVDDVSETTRRHKKLSPERVSTVKTKSEVVHVEHVPGTVVTEVPVEEKTKRKARAEALVETEDSARRSRSPVFEQTEEKVHKIKMPKASEEGTNMISTSKVTESPVTTAVTHDNIHISEISHVKSRPEEIYHRGGHRDDIFIGMEDFRPSEISETSRKELHSETVHPRDYDVVTGKRHATPVKEHLQEQVINVDNLASTETRPREESAKISASKSRSPVFEHLEETVSTFTVKQPDERGSKKVTDIAREEEEISRLQQTRLTGDEAVHTVAVRAEGDAVHHHGGFGEVDRWGPGLELVPEPEDETDIRQLHPVQQSVDEHVVETDQTAKKQKPRTVKIREESVLVEHRPSSALSEIHEAQVKPVAPVVIRVPKTGEATMESLQESIVTTRTPREIEQQLPAPQQEVRFEEESAHRVRDETIYHHGGFGDIDRSGYGLELAPGTLHEESLQERKPVQQRSWEEEVTHAERKRSPQREIAKIHEENVFIEHRPSSPVPAEVSHVRQISAKPAPVRAPKPIEPAIESLEESVAVTKIPREREELQRAIPSAVSFHEEQMGRDVARVRSAEAIRHHGGFADIDRWGNLGDGREIFLEGRETVAKASVPVVTHDEARQRQRSPVKTVKVKEESVLVHRTASPMRDTFETVRSVAPVVEAVPARAPKPSELTLTQHEEFVTKEKAPVRAPAVPEAESGPKKSRSKTEKITHFVPLSDRGFESKLFSPTSKIREKIYQAEQETSSVSKKVKIFEDESGIEFGRAAEERMAELQSTRSGPTMTSGGQSADSKKRETSAFSFLTKQKSIDEMEVRREKPLTILESMGIKNEPVIQMETVPAQTFVPQYVIPHEKRISSRSRERETLQETITKTTTAPRSDVAAGQRPSRASLFELWHRTTPRDIDIATVDLDEQPHRHREDEVSTRAVTPASERIPKFVRMDEGVVVQQARSSSRTESETSLEGILRRSPSRGSPTLKTKSETVHVETRRTPSPNISKEEHSFSYETGKESRPRTPPVESLSESIRTHRVERTKQLGSEVKKVMSGGTSTVVKAEGEPAKVTNAPPTRYIQDIETPWVAEERPDSMLIRHRTGVRDDYIGGFGSDTEAEKPVVKPRKSRERSVERLEESVSEVSVPSLAKTRHRSPEVQLEHMDVVRPLDRHAQEIHTVTPEVQPTRADRSASKKVLVEETVVVTTRTSVKPPVAPVLEEDQRQRREHVAGDEYRIEESQSLPRPDGRDVWHRAGPRDIDIATVSIPVVHSHRKETVEMVIRPKESEEETVNIRHVASVHRPVETQEDLAVSSATKHRPAEERVEEFVTRSREPRVRPEAVEHVTGIPDREIVHEDETKAKAKAKSQSDTYEIHGKSSAEHPPISSVTERTFTHVVDEPPTVSESSSSKEDSTGKKSGVLGFLRSGKGKKEENAAKSKSTATSFKQSTATIGLTPKREDTSVSVEELIYGSKKSYKESQESRKVDTTDVVTSSDLSVNRGSLSLIRHHPGCADKDWEPATGRSPPVSVSTSPEERLISTTVAGYPADEEKRPSSRTSIGLPSFIAFDRPEKTPKTAKTKKEKRISASSTSGRSTPSSFTSATISDSEMPAVSSQSTKTKTTKVKQISITTEKKTSKAGGKVTREEIFEDIMFTRPPSRRDKLEYVVNISASSERETRNLAEDPTISPRQLVTPEPTRGELVVPEYGSSDSASPTFDEYFTVPVDNSQSNVSPENETVSVTVTRTQVREVGLEDRDYASDRRTTLEFLPELYPQPSIVAVTEPASLTVVRDVETVVTQTVRDFQPDRRTSLEFPVGSVLPRQKVISSIEELPSKSPEERIIHNVGLSDRNYEAERRTSLEVLPIAFDKEKSDSHQMQTVPAEIATATVVRAAEPDFAPDRRTSLEFNRRVVTGVPSEEKITEASESEALQRPERLIHHTGLSDRNYEPERRTSLEYLPAIPQSVQKIPAVATVEENLISETTSTEVINFEVDRRTSLEFSGRVVAGVRSEKTPPVTTVHEPLQRPERVIHHTGLSDRNYEPERRTSLEYLPVAPQAVAQTPAVAIIEEKIVTETRSAEIMNFEADRRTSLEFTGQKRVGQPVKEVLHEEVITQRVRKVDNVALSERQYEDDRRTSLEFLPSLPVVHQQKEEAIVEEHQSTSDLPVPAEIIFTPERRTSLEFNQPIRPLSPAQTPVEEKEPITTKTVVRHDITLSDRNYESDRRTSLEFLPEPAVAKKPQEAVIMEEVTDVAPVPADTSRFEGDRRTSLEFFTQQKAKPPITAESIEETVHVEHKHRIVHNVNLGDRDFEPERRTSLEFLPEVQVTRVRPEPIVEETDIPQVASIEEPSFAFERRTSLEFSRDRPVRPPRSKQTEVTIDEESVGHAQQTIRSVHHVSLEERSFQPERRSTLEFLPSLPPAPTKLETVSVEEVIVEVQETPKVTSFDRDRKTSLEFDYVQRSKSPAKNRIEITEEESTVAKILPKSSHESMESQTQRSPQISEESNEDVVPRGRPNSVGHRSGISDNELAMFPQYPASSPQLLSETYPAKAIQPSEHVAESTTTTNVRPAETVHATTGKPAKVEETAAQKIRKDRPLTVETESVSTVTTSTEKAPKEKKKSGLFGLFKSGKKDKKKSESEAVTRVRDVTEESTERRESVSSSTASSVSSAREIQPPAETEYVEETVLPPRERPESVRHRSGLSDDRIANWTDPFRAAKEVPVTAVMQEEHRVVTRADETSSSESETDETHSATERRKVRTKKKSAPEAPTVVRSAEHVVEYEIPEVTEKPVAPVRTHKAVTVETLETGHAEEYLEPRLRPEQASHRAGMSDLAMDDYAIERLRVSPSAAPIETEREVIFTSKPGRETETIVREVSPEIIQAEHETVTEFTVPEAKERKKSKSIFGLFKRKSSKTAEPEVTTETHVSEVVESELSPGVQQYQTKTEEFIGPPQERPTSVHHRTGLTDNDIIDQFRHVALVETAEEKTVTLREAPTEEVRVTEQHRTKAIPAEEIEQETVVIDESEREKVSKSKSKGIFGLFKSKKSKETTAESVTKVRDESELEHIERTHPEVFQPVQLEELTGPPRERPDSVIHRVGYPDSEMERYIPAETVATPKPVSEEHISETVVRDVSEPVRRKDVEQVQSRIVGETLEVVHPSKSVVPVLIEAELPPRDRPHAVEHRSNLSDMEYESISRQYPGEVRTEVVETTRTHPHAEEYLDETLLVTESARPVVPSRKAKVTEEHEVIETLTPRDRPAAVVHRTGLPDWEIVEDHARMSPPPELQKIREESITIKKTPETVIVKQPSEEEMRTYSETVVTESEDVEKVKKEKSKSKGIFGVFKSKKSKEASSESVTKVRDESEVEYTERAHSEVMQPVRMEEEIVTGPPRDRPLPVNHRVGYPDWEMERHIPAEELVQQKAKDAEHISESVIVRETSEPALKPVVVDTKPVVERRVRTASRETLAIIPPPPFVVPEIIHSTAAVIVPPSIPVTKPVERAPVVAFPETLEIISAPELVRPLLVEPTQAIVVVPPPRPKPVVRETLEIIQAPDVVMPVLVESTQAVVVKPVVVETKPIILPAVKVASRESLDIISPPPLVAPLYIEPTQAVIVPFIPPVITKPVVERPLRSAERETLEIIPPPDTLMPVLIEPTQAVARRVLQPKVAIPQEEHFEETVTVIRDAPTPARRAKKVEVESSTSSESESEDESVVVRRARPASRVLEESILEVEEPMSPRERPSAVAHRFNVPDRDIIHLLPQETVSSHEHLQESVVVKSSEKTVKPAVPARTSKKVSISSESETEREAVRKVVSATETHHVTEVQVPRDRPAAIEHRYNVTDRDIAVASGLLLPRETLEENVTYSQQKVTAKKPVEERRTEEIVSTRVGIEPARMMPPPRVTTEHIVAEEPVLTPRMRPPFVVHPYGVPDRDIETISRRFPFPEETRPESEILQERVVTESVKTAKPAVPPRSVAEKTVVREDVAIMEERQPKAAPVQPERVEHLVPRERPPVIYHRGKFADYEIEPIASRYVPVAAEPAVEKRQEERVRSDTEHIHETVSVVTTTRSSSPPRTRAVAPVEVEEVHLSPRERPAEIHHPARLSDFEIEPLAAKYSPVLVPAVPVTEKRKVEERVPASEHLRETVTVVSTARVPSPTRTKIAPVEETEIEHLTPRERPPKIRHRGKNSDYDIEAIAAKYAPISAEPAVKPLKSSTTEYEHVTVTTKTTAEPSVKFGVSERSKMVKDVFAMEQGPPIVAARLIPAQISQEFVTVREVSPPIRVHRHEEEVVHLTPRERPAAVEHKAGLRDENINMFATRLADMTAVEGKKAKKVEVSSSSSSESESEQERVTVRKMRPTEKIVRDDTSSDEEFGRVHSERVRHVHLQDIQRKPAPTEEYSEMVVRTIEPTREAAEFPPRERPGKVQHFVGTSDVSLENALVTREPVTETDETLLEETVFRRTGAAPVAPKPAARKTKSEELFEESERRSRGEVIVQESELMKQKKFVKGRRSPSPSLSTSDTERKRPTKVLVKMDDMPTVVRSAESVEHREEASKKKSTIKIAQEEVIYTEQEEKRKQEALDRERELKSRTATPASISTTEAVSRSVSGTRSRTPDGSTKIKSVKVTKMKVEPKSSKSETKEYIYEDVNYYKTAKRSKTPDAISRGHTIATTSVASTSPEAQVVRSKTLPYQERSPDEVRESEHITATKVREVPPERERMEERVRKTEVTAVAVGKKLKKKRSQSSTSSSSSREDADEISSVTKSKLTSPTPEPRDDVQLALAEMKSKKVSPREESDEEVTVSRRHVVSPDRVASPPPILHHVTPGDAEIAEYLRHMRPFATGPYTEHEIQPTRLDVEQEHEAVLTTTTHVVAPVAARKERRSSRSSTSSTESEDEHGHKVRRKRRPVQKIAEEYVTTRTYPDEEAVKKQAGHRDSEIGVALIERTKTEQLPSYISFGRLEPDSPRRSVEYRSQDEYRDRSLSPYPRDKILHRAGPKDFQIDYVEMLAEPFKPPRRDKESMQTYYYGDTADDVEEGVFREVSHKRRSAPTHEMEMMQTATVVHPGRPEKMGTLEKSELRTISRESSKVEKPTTSQQSVTYVRESPALRRQQWETSHDLTTTSTPPPSGEYLEEHVEHYRVKLSHDLEELRAKSPKLYKDPDDIKEMRTVSGLSGRSSRAESSRTTSPAPLGLPYPPAYLVGRGMSAEREIVSPIEREKTDQVSPLKETQATSTVYTQPIIKKRVIPTRDSIEDDMVVADVRQVKTQPIEVETARAEAVPVQRRTDVREYSVSERERNQNRESTISDTATYMEIPERPSPVTPSSTAATLPVSSMVATRTEVRRSRSHELTPIYAKVQKKRKGYTETLEEDVFYWKLFKPGKKSYSEERMRARSPENVLTPDEIQVLQRSVSPLVLAEGDKHHRHKEKSERVTRSQGVRRSESDVDVRRSTSPGLKDSERFTDGRERYDIDLRLTTTLGDDRSAHSSLSRRTKEHLTLPAVPTPPRSRQMLSESPEGTPMHVRSFSPASGEFVSERLSQHEAVRVSSVSEEGERSSVDETSRIRKGLLADVESETRLRAARDDADMMYRAAMREPLPDPHSCLLTYNRLYGSVEENLLELEGLIVDPDCQYIDQELLNMEKQRFTAFLDGLVRINRDLDRLDDLYRAMMTVESGEIITEVDTRQRQLNGLYMSLLQQLKSILRRIRHLEFVLDLYRKRRLQFKVRLLEELTYFRTNENMSEEEQKERVNQLLEEVLILRAATYNMFVRSTPEFASQLEIELHEILTLLRTELRGSIIQLLLTGRYSVEFDATEQKLILSSDEMASAEIPTSTSRFSNPTVWSVLRRALPMQALALILLGFASLIPMTDDEFSCLFSNYFASSFNPALKFSGPPPI
ncbi:titin-like isoform X2 [Paramacrobiotus metropolitanus]|uniref:titin-like isoform X2 n=1 Tax=Paramacrobiotus metropolitanus TaxID=2943436 RepID=UPI002445BF0E|nr:titin-like isoform X2 [Paramacrobiotus metropolitanus]